MAAKADAMKRNSRARLSRHALRASEDGQTSIFVLLAVGIFLLGFVGFAVDMTNLWFHRQNAQSAADAACQAGIMDVLEIVQGTALPSPGPGFKPGSPFDCSASSAATPCWYANQNGYNGKGLVAGIESNDVAVSFPSTNPGLPPCSSTVTTDCIPPATVAAFPFLEVDLTDRFRLTFASLLSGQKTMDVKAKAVCALVLTQVPVPIIIMNQVCPWTLNVNSGSGSLTMVGGPPLSIEVNSSNASAVPSSTGTIDLSSGGPNYSGSDLGTLGGVSAAPSSFVPGTTGAWVFPHLPISDPFYNLPVPAPPPPANYQSYCAAKVNPCPVPYNFNGCPDSTGQKGTAYGDTPGCFEFSQGLYTQPIVIKNFTAIFDPGVYYLTGTTTQNVNCAKMPSAGCFKASGCRASLVLLDKSIVRPSTAKGDGSGGTMFYFAYDPVAAGYGSVFVNSNSGTTGGSRTVDNFGVTPPGGASALATCPGGASPDPKLNLPPSFSGNVFLAPCTGTYGTADIGGAPARGMTFWDDRDNADPSGQPTMQGGGSMLLAGAMYFHNCASKDGAHLGTNCSPATNPPSAGSGYQGFFQLQGSSGSTSYIIGFLITDDLETGGGGAFAMSINKNLVYQILKATLVQ
jgi:preprotein translocase subunit Sss1